MTARRALTVAVLSGIAAGAVMAWAATRTWRETTRQRPSPLPVERVVETGGDIAAWSLPAALVVIAACVAFVATSGGARVGVAIVAATAGVAGTVGGVHGLTVVVNAWPVLLTLSSLAAVCVSAWVIRAGAAWPRMSARYDRAADAPPPAVADDPQALWDALDRGVDPTSPTIGQTAPGEECTR